MLHVCQLTWWRRFHNWFSGCDTEKMRMAWMAWMARDPLSHPGYSRIILHLVGGLEHDFYNFPYIYIGNFIIPTDELTPSFFRGVGWNHQPEKVELSKGPTAVVFQPTSTSKITQSLPVGGISNPLRKKWRWKNGSAFGHREQSPAQSMTPWDRRKKVPRMTGTGWIWLIYILISMGWRGNSIEIFEGDWKISMLQILVRSLKTVGRWGSGAKKVMTADIRVCRCQTYQSWEARNCMVQDTSRPKPVVQCFFSDGRPSECWKNGLV